MVAGSKDNQLGSGEPSDITALTDTVPVPVDPDSPTVAPLFWVGLFVIRIAPSVCAPVVLVEVVLVVVPAVVVVRVTAPGESPTGAVPALMPVTTFVFVAKLPPVVAGVFTKGEDVSPANTDSGTVNAKPVTGELETSVIAAPFTRPSTWILTKPCTGAAAGVDPNNDPVCATGASEALTGTDGDPVDAGLGAITSCTLLTTAVCSTVTLATSAGGGAELSARGADSTTGVFV